MLEGEHLLYQSVKTCGLALERCFRDTVFLDKSHSTVYNNDQVGILIVLCAVLGTVPASFFQSGSGVG